MSTRDFSWGKGGRCVRLTTYHPCSAECQVFRGLNLGPSRRPVVGDLYLFTSFFTFNNNNNNNNILTAIGFLPGGSGYFTCIQI